MARKPTQAEVFADLLARYEKEVAEAFRAAIDDLRSQADLAAVIEALTRNDISGAIDALHLDPAAYGPLLDAVQRSYAAGGVAGAGFANAQTPGGVVIRFDGRNFRAEQWLRERSSTLVTNILQDQRVAVRQALTNRMAQGANPRTAALDIVGRVDRATGKRAGGILGLTSTQEGYVASARTELQTADPASLANYFNRARRDKRFDRTIRKAVAEGKPVPADTIAKAEEAYKRRLLQLRGEVISQVETFDAIAAGKHEAYVQAADSGKVDVSAITKGWHHFDNEHPRMSHIAMNGKRVGLNEAFVLPDGTRMLYPHAPDAPIKHKAGCHCQADYRIDFLAGIK